MNGDDGMKRTDTGEPSAAYQPGGAGSARDDAEIAPRAETSVERAADGTLTTRVIIPRPPGGDGGRPPVVRMRRSILIWLVCLLLVAILAVAGLVLTRPKSGSTTAAATASPTAPTSTPTGSTSVPNASAPAQNPGAAATATGAATAASAASAGPGGSAGSSVTNLSALTPVQNYYAENLTTGPEQIGTTIYQTSVRFTCTGLGGSNNTNIVYDVAGYRFLTGTFGTPSDATNAAGNTMTVTFFKDGSTSQLGKALTIALDHPAAVHLNLQGSSQLEIACAATNGAHQSVSMDLVLGNATIGPS